VRTDELIDYHSDGIHTNIGVDEDRHLEATTDFPYDEVDAALGNEPVAEFEDSITWAEASSCLIRLLQWITSPDKLEKAGARAHLAVYLLDPSQCKYGSLRELAEASGCTKQALSKALMDWRPELKVGLNLGKRAYTSENYRQAQYRSIQAGTHYTSARKRRDSKS
jgi:hypothetical protein